MTPFTPDLESLAHVAAAIHTHGHVVQIVGTGECSVPGCDCPMEQWHQYYSAFGPYIGAQVVQGVLADERSRFPWHAD